MKKFIFLVTILTLIQYNNVIAKEKTILDYKYEKLAYLVNQDIDFVKENVNKIDTKMSEDALLNQLIKEVESAISINEITTNKNISTYSSGLISAMPGAVYYYPATTSGINHGHVGIYTKNSEIAEALGERYPTRVLPISQTTMVTGQTNIYIVNAATTNQKNIAANWAYNIASLGLPYNNAFWSNKYCNPSDLYNCSQLVWCAYKQSTEIDIDSNGGFGVYPNDIINSGKLTYATTC